MPRKEFVQLMEENILILDRLSAKMRIDPAYLSGYPRQQLRVLVRLQMGGRSRLKDMARREMLSTPNLCAAFRKLEKDGLVRREIDENDRRNVWYCATPKGQEIAQTAMDNFRCHIDQMFDHVSMADEKKLTQALGTVKEVLHKMELENADA